MPTSFMDYSLVSLPIEDDVTRVLVEWRGGNCLICGVVCFDDLSYVKYRVTHLDNENLLLT